MNDDLMFDYLVQMGQMRPEQDELKRKQALVDALRKGAMTPQQGEMIGKHYVGPGIAGAISQLGQAYMAGQGQMGVEGGLRDLNARQAAALEELRKRRRPGVSPSVPVDDSTDPYSNLPAYGNRT